ncbi:CRISPR-associated endoribonuclease Cas6 [Clostridium sp. Cult2]|uniref:CRISPR-associated endoribonuclease Cas6 n=1 Tax=Clostridium sp. Cult2 TaxID=2079003 RepID=UPI001F01569B|nr:CRISPR-associated endoribonuclease Cas6 [Clostridium sp. Cult2]MCF6464462.1 CRISPR-associated endoribonuclease Cas6 [Clostridium sp. Cult2]
MKETVTFQSIDKKDEIVLPIHYNHMIQAMIYSQLDEEVAEFLHEEGFRKEKRTYKLFTFSRLLGRFNLDKQREQIKFNGPVKLIISSSYSEFSNSIGNSLLSAKTIRLGNNRLEAKELAVERETVNKDEIIIETLSPITTYSTLLRKDGKRFTYYFSPEEREFSEIISNNLKNKYKAFYLKDAPDEDVSIQPIGYAKLSILKYKGFIIKGYMGKFRMKGPIPLLQMGVEAGIGSKNSQGLGCVKII